MPVTISALGPVVELDRWVSEFERAWQEGDGPELADFLPHASHPEFARIFCELVCIDLEMRWSRNKPKRLTEYRTDFPVLFRHAEVVEELAYEEYRQRVQAGATVDPSEYRDRFGVDVSGWPANPQRASIRARKAVKFVDWDLVGDDLPKTAAVQAGVMDGLQQSLPAAAARYGKATAQMPGCGDRLFGFELIEQLGEGAFAKVFLACQLELGDRPVVLKIAPTLRDEPRKLARLQHTNIVPIYSAHETGALHAVCMPYLGSTTLAQVLKNVNAQSGSFPDSGRALLNTLYEQRSTIVENQRPRDRASTHGVANSIESSAAMPILDLMARLSHVEAAIWMGARLADGLAHAHERGILHLDLKPANILLTDDGQPMLLDFNLSIDLNDPISLQMARCGGTLPFMSPEQLEAFRGGQRAMDGRSDLFSLGIILFEMLTGKAPFPKRLGRLNDVIALMIDDRRKNPPSLRQLNTAISPAVEGIVRKLLDPDPARRYESAAHLREDFERQLAHQPLKYAPDRSLSERFHKWRWRNPRLATATLVAVVASVLLLLPATVLAIRQSQIAERRMQVETAEARQLWQDAGKDARLVQVLLATQIGNRADLERGLAVGQSVLDKYRIGHDPQWLHGPLVARLPREKQDELRLELGEMLLFMARGEQMRAEDAGDGPARKQGLRQALRWNELAAGCYPLKQIPRLLSQQRLQLVELLPGDAASVPMIEPDATADYDPYHDAVEHTMGGQYREALALLAPFTENHPQHYQSWFVRGICHDRIGENEESAACWTGCIALEPTMARAYWNRGVIRLWQGKAAPAASRFRHAESDFTRALELQPDWHDALMDRAVARKALKDYEGAIADVDKAIQGSKSSVRAWFLRAEINELDGKPDAAKADRARGLELTPNDDDELGWSSRGYIRMTTEPAAALEDLDKAIKLNPRSLDALINKSIILSESLNRLKEAVAALDQLLKYYPDHNAARAGRGVVLARLGECARARQDAEECLRHERSGFFLFQIAGLYSQISRHEKAPDAKEQALRLLAGALRNGFSEWESLKTDRDLDPIREETEFKRLLQVAAGLEKSPPN